MSAFARNNAQRSAPAIRRMAIDAAQAAGYSEFQYEPCGVIYEIKMVVTVTVVALCACFLRIGLRHHRHRVFANRRVV